MTTRPRPCSKALSVGSANHRGKVAEWSNLHRHRFSPECGSNPVGNLDRIFLSTKSEQPEPVNNRLIADASVRQISTMER